MGGIEQYTPSSRGGVLTNIPPLDNSKILLMGVLTNIPPPPEGGYWPIYPLERILLLSRWVYPGKYPAIQNTIIYFSPYYNGCCIISLRNSCFYLEKCRTIWKSILCLQTVGNSIVLYAIFARDRWMRSWEIMETYVNMSLSICVNKWNRHATNSPMTKSSVKFTLLCIHRCP